MVTRPRLLFLHTGGTLAMTKAADGRPLEPALYDEHMLPYVHGLEEVAEIEGHVICNLDSSDMTPDLWEAIGKQIAERREEFTGFVVLHGTDTMAYTACALSFMLRGLDRPVVLTGSQRPLAELRTDARLNLVHAALCATMPIPEVTICFGGTLFRGNRATKVSIQDYDAFRSPNAPPLLRIGVDIRRDAAPLVPSVPFTLQPGFERQVAVIDATPGVGPEVLGLAAAGGARAVVVRAFGEGNLPQRGWPEAIAEARAVGCAVVVTSQCGSGSVWPGRYVGSSRAAAAGATFAKDLTLEATVVKTMWLLAREGATSAELAARLTRPVAGECS